MLADLPVPAQGLRSGRPAPAFRRLIMASTPPTASTASPSTTSAARNAPRRLPAVRRRLRTLGTGVRVWGLRTWPLVQVALEVQDYAQAVSWAAQTALRDIIGRTTLADLPRGRERIEAELQ